jgi:hypothetical protein
MQHRAKNWSRAHKVRVLGTLIAVAATASTTAAIAANSAKDQGQPAPLAAFVKIADVRPNVQPSRVRQDGSTGTFTVDCGTNGNRKFSPDNPVAQPGVKNSAQHVHDFVGNLSISAQSSDESLEDSDTTCRNGDKSSYFWPVVRINKSANAPGASQDSLKAAGTPAISCPTVADRLPAGPDQARREVDQNLRQLDQQIAEANQRLATTQGQGGANFVDNATLGPLKDKRTATIDRMAIAIGRNTPAPSDSTGSRRAHSTTPTPETATGTTGTVAALPGAEGPNFEVAGNIGGIVQPASVTIEYRGSSTSKVVAMPKFLKMITGDAKPTSRGPANARATWTCSGFTDRLSTSTSSARTAAR